MLHDESAPSDPVHPDTARADGRCAACRQTVRVLVRGLCRACLERAQGRDRAGAAIAGLLAREDVLILDTETTGLSGAEVIEVSVIDTSGRPLLDTLVKPRRRAMNPHAERVHGISLAMLEDAPTWPDVFPKLAEIAERATLLAWNAPFDASMLRQTSAAWNLEQPSWLFVCAMRLYAKRRGLRARGLHKALLDERLEQLLAAHASHRALGDSHFVLEVLRASLAEPAERCAEE